MIKLTVSLNTTGLINRLKAVRVADSSVRVIMLGSSDKYGSLGENDVNVTEDMPVNQVTPYAVSKSAQDSFAQLYTRA